MPWVKACEEKDVPPGASKIVQIRQWELSLFHLDDGIYCIDNVCPHHGGPLAEGFIRDGHVLCPWHAWEFNIRSGIMSFNKDVCVSTFPCRIEKGEIWVEAPE